jgi:hypothetical protein
MLIPERGRAANCLIFETECRADRCENPDPRFLYGIRPPFVSPAGKFETAKQRFKQDGQDKNKG